ncbi:winged helix-turn-helix transcriptional regulator [Phreatobacter stygius]|uniref:Helix-turn-helix transcriptional regulator n=1 Tax=Phreatobacter stygius TaxID=1940610 RepID=A0A4D7BGM6_9HYPH|nr:helix-turn-helix domain-containing protein [Phreatobacter stygius]QCI66947.1 helix-turn-helix transcriptional regulator [Phreatobacter stygius]
MKESLSECPIEDAMRVLGGRWRSLVVYYLKDGPKRFSDLRRDMPKISQRMLTLDLRELEAIGVVSRTVYPEVPPRVEYELTADGRKLMPVIDALGDWWVGVVKRRRSAQGPARAEVAA